MTTIDPAVLKEFEEYIDMFCTPGWKNLMRDMEDTLEQEQKTAAGRCATNDQWQVERGSQARTRIFLNFEAGIRNAYAEAIAASQETEEDRDDIEQGHQTV